MINQVNVKLLRDNTIVPDYKTSGSVCCDLYVSDFHKTITDKYDIYTVGFGIALELPKNLCAKLYMRSSLGSKGYILSNSVGIIDQDYRGEILAVIFDFVQNRDDIKLETRIAQLEICEFTQTKFNVVDSLKETDRNSGGFGSTGK